MDASRMMKRAKMVLAACPLWLHRSNRFNECDLFGRSPVSRHLSSSGADALAYAEVHSLQLPACLTLVPDFETASRNGSFSKHRPIINGITVWLWYSCGLLAPRQDG